MITLENWLRNKLYETEQMGDYDVATETIRCWIDIYNDHKKEREAKEDEWISNLQDI